jgi:GNAT superfamily N-acetyltransferase
VLCGAPNAAGLWSIEIFGAAEAACAERALAHLLCACVDAGASVSFLPPLPLHVARAFWRDAAAEVAAGKRLLLGAWIEGALVGTVTIDLATPPNQPHRAEVQKLLVHPSVRRRGIARTLMMRAEEAALASGRTLLTLDTRAGHAGELLYRQLGWTEAGRIPGYALSADGTPCDTILFWKRLS